MQMDIHKNKILAKISQYIAKTKTTIYLRLRNLLKSIYLSRFFVFFRPLVDRLRKLLRPFYQWVKPRIIRRKILISYLLILGLVFGVLLGIFFLDLKKDYGYDPVEPADYSGVDWQEKIDNNGYSMSKRGNFKWKIVISPPNKSFIFKPSKDIAEVKMYIRDLRGSIQIPANVTVIDQAGNSSKSKTITSIANQEELTLVSHAHFTSLLGLSFISPLQGETINVNGAGFNTATIQLPQNTKVIKFGDNNFANSYKIDERNYFFHSFTNPAIVYYHYNFHTFIQIIIFLIILISILGFLYFEKLKIKKVKFSYKDFAFAGLSIFIIMVIFSLLIPNPTKLILNYSSDNTTYGNEQGIKIYKHSSLPGYLRWVLFVNQSFDGVIIGNVSNCSVAEFKIAGLGMKKIIIAESFKNNSCARKLIADYPQKIVIAPNDNIMDEIKEIKARNLGYNQKLFKYNAKLIFVLSNILLAIFCAFLIWLALNIKKLTNIIFFIIFSFTSYFLIMFIYIFIGALAHMPIGYHGATDTGLIMSNYFMPNVISGGNNIRLLFAFMGLMLIIILSARVFKKISYKLLFLVVFVFSLLMLIPNTEYHTKRFILSGLSAEAYIWDYKMDVFNSLDLYKSIREVDFIDYYKEVTDKETYGEREIEYANSLANEGKILQAQENLERIIIDYGEIKDIKAKAINSLAAHYLNKAATKEEDYFGFKKGYINQESYYKLALDYYLNFIQDYPDNVHIADVMHQIAIIFMELKDYDKATKAYETIIKLNPEASYVPKMKINLAEVYLKNKNYAKAIDVFNEIVNYHNYPEEFNINLMLAMAHNENGNKEKALQIYHALLEKNAGNIAQEIIVLSALNKFYGKDPNAQNIIYLSRAFNLEALGKNKEALRQYLNIENSLENNLYRAIAEYRATELINSAVNYLANNDFIDQEAAIKLKEVGQLYPDSYLASIAKYYNSDIADNNLSPDKNYEIFTNTDFENFDMEEVYSIDNFNIKYNISEVECGNNICEMGESPTTCSGDCTRKYSKISVIANVHGLDKNIWPLLQISVNGELIAEKTIDTEITSNFEIPFEYYGSEEINIGFKGKDDNANEIFIKSVYLNQEEIAINKILKFSSSAAAEEEKAVEKTIPLSEKYSVIKGLKDNVDLLLAKVIPYGFETKLNTTKPSRGMVVYFTAIFCFLFVLLYTKSLRTIAIPFFMLFVARGIVRVAEQDPFRAWNSIYPGLITGVQLTFSFIAINSILFFLALILFAAYKKFKWYLKKHL